MNRAERIKQIPTPDVRAGMNLYRDWTLDQIARPSLFPRWDELCKETQEAWIREAARFRLGT